MGIKQQAYHRCDFAEIVNLRGGVQRKIRCTANGFKARHKSPATEGRYFYEEHQPSPSRTGGKEAQ